MNQLEKQWFDALTKDRSDSARTLEKPSMRGIQRSVVDKYSDQAHFIYELLQNANDVMATSARFRLVKDGLLFSHNGCIPFTVSNPQTEDADANTGALGHINSITSIANSNKTEASIGKFGVGFKAVFQYTQTPHIYDNSFRFKIERFIVPHLLDADLPWRESTETVFWFPFDHQVKTPDECFEDILEKFKALDFPTLFLSHLKSVSFEAPRNTGKYNKEVKSSRQLGDIEVQRIALTLDFNAQKTTQQLLTVARVDEKLLPYRIGYSLGVEDKLVPIDRPAFCFFPTKEVTNLKFIVHAPFLLTDSREGIKAGEKHNQELIQQLAQLAGDSLPILRDEGLLEDSILDIIPYDEGKFSDVGDRRTISLKPFYTSIKSKLQSDALLPAANGTCCVKSSAYWASDPELIKLFDDKQLEHLTGTKGASWVFRSRGKKEIQNVNKVLADYIDGGDARRYSFKAPNLIASSLEPEAVLRKLTSDFIVIQSRDWLHRLYAYLSERASYQEIVKDKPIFLDQDNNAVSAFDGKSQLILFLPDNDLEGYKTVHNDLQSNRSTLEFIQRFGVKKPSLRDEIYNKILPAYERDEGIDTAPHFNKFFRFFKDCRNDEVADYLNLIKGKAFLLYTTAERPEVFRGKAADMYLPTPDLEAWFDSKPSTKFILLDKYHAMVDQEDHGRLKDFLLLLGIRTTPSILSRETVRETLGGQNLVSLGNYHKYTDRYLDGCEQIVANIDKSKSLLLWHILINDVQLDKLRGMHTWFYYTNKAEYFNSRDVLRLLKSNWILNNSDELVSVDSVTVQTLSAKFETESVKAKALISFLGIRDQAQAIAHLSDEEARKIRLADKLEQSGLSEDEILTAINDSMRKKAASKYADISASSTNTLTSDIESRRPSINFSNSPSQPESSSTQPVDANEDADDYLPKAVDYSKKIDRAKDRAASELDRIEREQELNNKANTLPRYSYGWLLALLELECMASSEKNADSKTISISFGSVEQDQQSSRAIVLKEPSRFIPQSIEELSGVRVDLDFGKGFTGKLRVESFTAKEFSLLGKVESSEELEGSNLDDVVEARIEIQNPAFLLQELLERFRELKLSETFDMKNGLTPDIEFVFGPPGTGKTTHLAKNVLIPIMKSSESLKILVLTPTNKAADVLTSRIMEKADQGDSLNWLVRFGTSVDERIEKAGIWRDRSFNINSLSRSVTVTTVARFAYDGFSGLHGKKLYEMDWHLIIIDEASMVSLANIVYPLYKAEPQKFIIAGDPFQIEPIAAVEQWQDENIYTLVGLNKAGSFAKPATEPHDYPITNLEMQYRSIPIIGDLFSRFTYNGILKHHREAGSQCPLKFNGVDATPLNIVKFPVSKYESIYRPKRLKSGTPYQTYSALFTFEFVRWLAGQQSQENRSDKLRIGVIAPYRAQALLLNRLNESWTSRPAAVEIQVGTIHGFQGDECDVIIAVLNPPPNISTSSRMFLNKQNILNVAISRARDYLFIVMPDDETEGVENLHKIGEIKKLVKSGGSYSEFTSPVIEHMIWGKPNYLEENTFSTGHHIVNVYRRPERYYEVRSDDSAIDVQIYEKQ